MQESLTEEEEGKLEVLCVNPSAYAEGSSVAGLMRYESTTPFPGLLGTYFQAPKASTPWVGLPGQYTGQCERTSGASWLQLTNVGPPGDPREQIKETLGPLWGTHLEDVNAALGNLVELTTIQSRVYLGSLQVTSVTPSSGSSLGGTAVTIKGAGFLPGATVTIGNVASSVNVVSETEITAQTTATAAGSYEVVVTDTNGTSTGGPSYTYYVKQPPTVVTGSPSGVHPNSATLNATVNPNGTEVSSCQLEYGITPAYGSSAPCTPAPESGSSPVAVSLPLTGLAANTTYHFRVVATNAGGTSVGSDQAFTTPLAPHWRRNLGLSEEGRKAPYLTWGALTLTSSKGGSPTECQSVGAGYVENPDSKIAESGAFERPGIESTEGLSLYQCTNAECETAGGKISVSAEDLPSRGVLVAAEKGTVRLESANLQLYVACRFAALAPVERKITEGPFAGLVERAQSEYHNATAMACASSAPGSLAPKVTNGPSTAKPSKTVYSGGAGGELECGGPGKLTITGSSKIQGYAEYELLTVASP